MNSANPPESELLKELLLPLLEDFQYWFSRSRQFLETEQVSFLQVEGQAVLLERVKQAQQEVSTTQMLLKLTQEQVGIESGVLMPWHQLVTECWQVATRHRAEQSAEKGIGESGKI